MANDPSVSVLDLVHSGRVSKDPSASIDPMLYGTDGKPLKYGNDDPNIVGPDSDVSFTSRASDDYPDLPRQVKDAEIKFLLPMANHLSSRIGITIIDDISYSKALEALRSRFLFVVLYLNGVRISDGIASWMGIVLMCKRHPVVTVQVKLRIGTGQIGIHRIKTWEKSGKHYLMHGDRSGGSFLSREEATALVFNYLNVEGIIPGI